MWTLWENISHTIGDWMSMSWSTHKKLVKNEHCPLNWIGCKFSHSMEPTDGKDAEDNKPTAEDNNADEATDESDAEQDYTTHENQCHLCKKQLSNKDEMWDHVETVHVEYFQGM